MAVNLHDPNTPEMIERGAVARDLFDQFVALVSQREVEYAIKR